MNQNKISSVKATTMMILILMKMTTSKANVKLHSNKKRKLSMKQPGT